jgi:WD40 repeat protein
MARSTPPFAGIDGPVRAVATTRDRDVVVTGGDDSVVRVWYSGALKQELRGPRGGTVLAVATDGDGDDLTVVSCHDDGVRRWQPWRRGGAEVTGHPGGIITATLSGNGALLATVDIHQTVLVTRIDGAATTPRREIQLPHEKVRQLAVAQASAQLVTGGDQPTAKLWNITGDEPAVREFPGHYTKVGAVAVTPDGVRVVTVDDADVLRIWDTRRRGDPIEFHGHTGKITTVAISPEGRYVVAGATTGGLWVWDRTRPNSPLHDLRGHPAAVRALAITPDGTRLISGTGAGTVESWDMATGALIIGTNTVVAPPHPLPGVISDEASQVDHLDFGADVRAMAALIADRDLRPPLAIALLGKWGSGKSSFMRQLRDEVGRLANQAALNPAGSVYTATVRQVSFNAWQFSDDQLWVGIAEHLFAELASSQDTAVEPDPSQVGAEADRVSARLAELRARRQITARGVAGLPAQLRLLWRERRTSPAGSSPWRKLVIAASVLAGLAAIAGIIWWLSGDTALSVLGTATGAVLAAGRAALPVLRTLWSGYQEVRSAHDSLRDWFDRRGRDLDGEIVSDERKLAELDAAKRLATFISDARGDWSKDRGVMARVHNDLRQLSEDMRLARRDWLMSGSPGQPPLQRIVLYIDDLDRCSPAKVAEALAAVHLLLALPLFTVVVAVDPRWLRRCLTQYQSDLFGVESDQAVAPTPLDYLDKIFQVPFALRPMGSRARNLINAALPPVAAEPGAAPSVPNGPRASRQASGTELVGVSETARMPSDPVAAPGQPPPADLSPQPEQLRLRPAEREFILGLGGLLDTPRSVKRLVNMYRLVRVTVGHDELDDFVGPGGEGPYQVVLVLLALVVAAPVSARALIIALRDGPEDRDVSALVTDFARTDSTPGGDRIWPTVMDILATVRVRPAMRSNLAKYRKWSGTVARFSFETCDLTGES